MRARRGNWLLALTSGSRPLITPAPIQFPVSIGRAASAPRSAPNFDTSEFVMKIRNSLKSLLGRHRENRLVRRKGRVYIINKTQKRYKARQG